MTNLRRAGAICFVAILACMGFQTASAGAQGGVVPAKIDVSIKLQRAYVYGSDGSLMREIPISSGRGGRTPLGHFRVTTKSEWTTATSNPKVHMRWMTRFNGGIGFHGIPRSGNVALKTPLGVRPVSHGCIRMADVDAQWIYQWVPRGTPVNVIPK
jgi:lipoprotein-anchoring transpeptidase ErfK/SrfK